jgi:cytochrome c-type biogenesis protein CcmE
VDYSGIVPDPFAAGRGVLVTVRKGASTAGFVGEQNSLTTKCPSKYQAASGSY